MADIELWQSAGNRRHFANVVMRAQFAAHARPDTSFLTLPTAVRHSSSVARLFAYTASADLRRSRKAGVELSCAWSNALNEVIAI
jgi:hypothetical protein